MLNWETQVSGERCGESDIESGSQKRDASGDLDVAAYPVKREPLRWNQSSARGVLIQTMRSQDDFEAFYQASYPRLVGQLTIMTGSLEDAEDAVQEAFARASTRWARLRDYDAPEAWVRRVAFNLATSGLRRARRQLAALARLGAPPAEPARSTDRLAIEAGLRRLPLHHRQVLVLHYGADLPVRAGRSTAQAADRDGEEPAGPRPRRVGRPSG